jgi:uncharacterized protein
MLPPIADRIATEIAARSNQVDAAIRLLDDGATVPFIARYRKEATGGLDDTQLRNLEERLRYLRELEARREAVLESIGDQGRLTPELETSIRDAQTKQRLEDLYAPYKPKRRTRAQIAAEAGLEALADALLADPSLDPETTAGDYLCAAFTTAEGDENPGVADSKAALDGARWILMERFAEDPELVGDLRELLAGQGLLCSRVAEGKADAGAKFRDYFDYQEALAAIPSHRALALFRGRSEDILRLEVKLLEELDAERGPLEHGPCEHRIASRYDLGDRGRPADGWLMEVVRFTWRARLAWQLETQLLGDLRERAEEEAIRVFARNLRDLLLAAPAGPRPTLGLDPGIRTGVKVAVVDGTGRLLDTDTVFPFEPRRDRDGARRRLLELVRAHGVELVAIGNGTASRETEQLVRELKDEEPGLRLTSVIVSEAGASVYSASEAAAREFPNLDVSLRGAASIARRLQDPLAELVKIEPKSIGVGQYQHDVGQTRLARMLDAVVEDCVNDVGVDLNMASVPLLTRVSGLSASVAENIVAERDRRGAFASRKALLDVPRLGPRTFEQAAGFLRIRGGEEPLDGSAVHPEAYPVARRILADLDCDLPALGRDPAPLKQLDPGRYTDDAFGLPTVRDILAELEKPGRDPRPDFRTAVFREGVNRLEDLEAGMELEGVVTNVTNFGAFVDVGVHQDGLVHVSELADRFVRDPHEVVSAGRVVRIRVLEVDLPRRRIALSMRAPDARREAERAAGAEHSGEASRPGRGGRGGRGGKGGGEGGGKGGGRNRSRGDRGTGGQQTVQPDGAMADALRKAMDKP